MKKQTEKALENKIMLNLILHGFYVRKLASHPGVYDYNCHLNFPGITDLLVIGGPNKVTFMEVKLPYCRNQKDGGLKGRQPEFRDLCLKNGISWAVVYSVGEALKTLNNQQEVKDGKKRR